MNSKKKILISRKFFKLEDAINKASKLQSTRDFSAALNIFESCLKIAGNNKFIELNIALCKFHQGKYREAAMKFHNLHIRFNEDAQIINFCGISYLKAGEYDVASQFLKAYARSHPNDFENWLNLTQAAGASQNNVDALYYATQAISIKPLDTRAHSNLGCTLLMLEKIDDALISLDTALQLDPNNFTAISNIASAFEKKGAFSQALPYYKKSIDICNKNSEDDSEIKNRMSLSLLGSGQLKQGWEYWDLGFKSLDSRSRSPKRSFLKPRWCGEDLSNKTIMIWREQGIGDEIRLFGLVNEIIENAGKVIIECQTRLVSLFKRSFPKCEVRESFEWRTNSHEIYKEDYDFQIPVGSLPRYLRSNLENFSPIDPYLKVDKNIQDMFRNRLSIYQNKKLLGFSWRSGLVTSERSKYFTPISEWGPIFSLKNTVFVNLQYGDCKDELLNAEKEFNIEIVNWSDIDLKQDIESAAALTSIMDNVITAPTSVADIAMAVGTNLKFFTPKTWEFLGGESYPWYKNAQAYIPSEFKKIESVLPIIANDLSK